MTEPTINVTPKTNVEGAPATPDSIPTPNIPNVQIKRGLPKKFARSTISLSTETVRRVWKMVYPLQLTQGDNVAGFGIVQETETIKDQVWAKNLMTDTRLFPVTVAVFAFVREETPEAVVPKRGRPGPKPADKSASK